LPNQSNGSKDNWGRTRHRQQTDRQTTDRQTDRQTDIFEPTLIHMGNLNFFFFAFKRERPNGVKFIPPCLLRKFTLLTCSARRGKNMFSFFLFLFLAHWGKGRNVQFQNVEIKNVELKNVIVFFVMAYSLLQHLCMVKTMN